MYTLSQFSLKNTISEIAKFGITFCGNVKRVAITKDCVEENINANY